MADDELAENLRDDLTSVPWDERAQDMLMTAGILAFGVALGVKWAGVDTINHLGRQGMLGAQMGGLAGIYNHHMLIGLAVAVVGLLGAFYLEQRRDRQ